MAFFRFSTNNTTYGPTRDGRTIRMLLWFFAWFIAIFHSKYYFIRNDMKIIDLLCDLKIEILKTKNWWVPFFMIFMIFDRSSVSRNIKMNHSDLIGMVLSPRFWNVKMNIIWCGLFQKDFFSSFGLTQVSFFCCT